MSNGAAVPVLALNDGSSSLKFGLYLVDAGGARVLVLGAAQTGAGRGVFDVHDADGNALRCDAGPIDTPHDAIERIAALLSAQSLPAPVAVGHRIVHGGPHCRDQTLIDTK